MSARTRLAPLVVLLLTIGACGSGEVTTTTATEPTTAATAQPVSGEAPTVTVVEDLLYRTDATVPHLVDVYHTGALGGPVVVLLHGGGVDKTYGLYSAALAPALAEQGAVVFVPNWDQSFGHEPEVLLANHDGTGCAISYAVTHAAGYGADPDRLVIFGHSGGATAAAAGGGLRETEPLADCVVEPVPIVADGLVLWDGDWLMSAALWDQYETDLPWLASELKPWGLLDDAPASTVLLVTAAGSRTELRRCGMSDPAAEYWVRDPDGWFRDRLESIAALDDGCIDIWEPTEILAQVMDEHGLDITHMVLAGSSHVRLGTEDQASLVDAIIAIGDD